MHFSNRPKRHWHRGLLAGLLLVGASVISYDQAEGRAGGGGGYRSNSSHSSGSPSSHPSSSPISHAPSSPTSGPGFSGVSRSVLSSGGRRVGSSQDTDWFDIAWKIVLAAYFIYRLLRFFDIDLMDLLTSGQRSGNGLGGGEDHRGALLESGLAALKERDPDFDAGAFTERISDAFLNIQKEWSERHVERIASLTTSGVRESFQLLLDMEKARGVTNITREVAVNAVSLVAVHPGPRFDAIQVKIEASAADFHVRTGTTEVVAGNLKAAPFTEFWTFLRRRDAKTKAGPSLLEGHCPSCAAPLQLTDRGCCNFCQAVVNSGAFDWVLAEITQAEASRAEAEAAPAALELLTTRDPAFNIEYVEDRAALMFWRVRAAELRGVQDPLLKIATAEFVSQHRAAAAKQATAAGVRRFYADAAVGSVRVIALQAGVPGQQLDALTVRIDWSGRPVQARLPALLPPKYDLCVPQVQDYILVRDAAAITADGQGLRTNNCAACGAPQSEGGGEACASCGTALNASTLDWLLSEIRPVAAAGAEAGEEAAAAEPKEWRKAS